MVVIKWLLNFVGVGRGRVKLLLVVIGVLESWFRVLFFRMILLVLELLIIVLVMLLVCLVVVGGVGVEL